MENSRPCWFQEWAISTSGQKFEVDAQKLLQHAEQAKEHPKITKAENQNPRPFLSTLDR